MDAPGAVLSGLAGLAVGSFLTVVAERVPEGRSVLWPPSSCPACGSRIAARDLVPVLSWLLLRGRCRSCGAPIPSWYPLLEAAAGGAWVVAYARFGPGWRFLAAAALLSLLLAVSAVDLRLHLIPNRLLLGGLLAAGPPFLLGGVTPWREALLGAVLCGGALLAVAAASRGGMGGGDVKLAALLGLLLGWRLGLLALVLAFLAGALAGLALLLTGRKRRGDHLAFGPFLALGAAAVLLWGEGLLAWYLGLSAR